MINCKPQPQDFKFTYKGFDYCIGFQDDEFETFAMSESPANANTWSWVMTTQIYDRDLSRWGSAVDFLKAFLAKCNEYLRLLVSGEPEEPKYEFAKLLYTVEHGLTFSVDSGVSIK